MRYSHPPYASEFKNVLATRWTIVFDTLGVEYEYESKKFDFEQMDIVPDFWLPKQKCWIEIGRSVPSKTEIKQAQFLAQSTALDVYLFYGSWRLQTFACNYCSERHYVEVPCGVFIMRVNGTTGSFQRFSVPLDELILHLVRDSLPTVSIHDGLARVQWAFKLALNYGFGMGENDGMKHISEILRQWR